MIQNLIFGMLFLKILGLQRFYIFPDAQMDIIRVISDFLAESLKANKN